MTAIDPCTATGPLIHVIDSTEGIMEVGIIVLLAVTIPTLFQVVRLATELRTRLGRIEERLADIDHKAAQAQ